MCMILQWENKPLGRKKQYRRQQYDYFGTIATLIKNFIKHFTFSFKLTERVAAMLVYIRFYTNKSQLLSNIENK